MMLLSFLALIPRSLLGFLAVHWIWRSVEIRDLIIKTFLAGPMGIGLSSLASFLWIWAGFDLGAYAALETFGALLLFLIVLWRERVVFAGLLQKPRLSLGKQSVLWLGLLIAAFILYTAESWVNVVQYPHGGWDAWNHWNVVSRFVYRGGEHWAGTFLRTGDHPDYPLLVPMSNAITWILLSRETTRGPIALSFFFTICLAGLLFGLLYKLRDARQATLGTIVLVSHSYMAIWAMAQYVDMDLAFYFLASIGLILIHFPGRENSLPILAGLMAGLAAWTKNEGLAFALLSALAWILSGRLKKTVLRNFLLGLLLPLLVVGLFKVFLAPENDVLGGSRDMLALLQEMGRYRTIIRIGSITFRNMDGSPIVILAGLLVYALIIGKTRTPAQGLAQAALVVLGQLGVYFVIFLITPYSPEWHVRSSIGRLYLQVAPLVLLSLFLWLKSPDELLPNNSC